MALAFPVYSTEQIKDTLTSLPQFNKVNQADIQLWIESLLENNPKSVIESIEKLTGFGGLDISILVMSDMGLFHPFGDASAVTRSKLLMDPIEVPNSHVRRSKGIIKLAKEEYREKFLAKGGKLRPDLLDKIKSYLKHPNPELEWVIGNVDDIVEENGKIYLVDYKSPSKSQYEAAKTKEPLENHVIQAHHYKILCNLAGVKIDGMRLFHFSSEEWGGLEQEVAFSSAMEERIKRVGSRFWREYTMQGLVAPEVTINRPVSLEELTLEIDGKEVELPDENGPLFANQEPSLSIDGIEVNTTQVHKIRKELVDLGANIFGQVLLKNQAESEKEELVKVIREILPMRALSPETTRIDLGQVRLKANWQYHEGRLLEAIRGLLALTGQDEESIARVLGTNNFHQKAEFSAEVLIQILKEKKGIDVHADLDFIPAKLTQDSLRTNTLVSFLRDLEKSSQHKINWKEMINFPESELTVELVKAPHLGFARSIRDETIQKMREKVNPIVERIGKDHVSFYLAEQKKIQDQSNKSKMDDEKPKRKSVPKP